MFADNIFAGIFDFFHETFLIAKAVKTLAVAVIDLFMSSFWILTFSAIIFVILLFIEKSTNK